MSQLGLIIIRLGAGYYLLAFFHLLAHALFKASLFLCAGRIIHSFMGRQDLRDLNGVTSIMPLTSSCLLICSLSLSGFPFLSAFFSKDKIIEESLRVGGNFLWLLMFIVSVMLTALYSFRLIFYIRHEKRPLSFRNISDRKLMTKRMIVLTLGGVIGGRTMSWLIFDSSYDNLFFLYKSLIIVLILLGVLLGLRIKFSRLRLFSFYLSTMWFLVRISTKFASSLGLSYGKYVLKSWDQGWNEILGPQGVKKEVLIMSVTLDKINHLRFKVILILSFLSGAGFIWLLFYYCSLCQSLVLKPLRRFLSNSNF